MLIFRLLKTLGDLETLSNKDLQSIYNCEINYAKKSIDEWYNYIKYINLINMSQSSIPQTKKFDKYDPLFENTYDKVGPEFGELNQSTSIQYNSRETGIYRLGGR